MTNDDNNANQNENEKTTKTPKSKDADGAAVDGAGLQERAGAEAGHAPRHAAQGPRAAAELPGQDARRGPARDRQAQCVAAPRPQPGKGVCFFSSALFFAFCFFAVGVFLSSGGRAAGGGQGRFSLVHTSSPSFSSLPRVFCPKHRNSLEPKNPFLSKDNGKRAKPLSLPRRRQNETKNKITHHTPKTLSPSIPTLNQHTIRHSRMRDDLQFVRDKSTELEIKLDREVNELKATVEKAKNDVIKSVIAIMGTFSAITFTISRFIQISS
jgi:hypothetical protein